MLKFKKESFYTLLLNANDKKNKTKKILYGKDNLIIC